MAKNADCKNGCGSKAQASDKAANQSTDKSQNRTSDKAVDRAENADNASNRDEQ